MIPKSGNRFSDKIMRKKKAMTMSISRVLFCALVIAAAALAPFSAHAAEKIDKLVTVTGEGTVAAVPDNAVIRLGVSSQGKTARAASDANAKEMTVVLAAIKESGVADRDIQTTSLSLQPQYDPKKTGAARLIGFQVTNQVTIKIRDIGQIARRARSRHRGRRQRDVGHRIRRVGAGQAARQGPHRGHRRRPPQGRALCQCRRHESRPRHGDLGRRLGAAAAPVPDDARGRGTPIAPGEQTLRAVVTVSYELTS